MSEARGTPGPDMATVRRRLRALRRAIPAAEQERAANAAATRLAALLAGAALVPTMVAASVADDGELDPAPAVARFRAAGARIALPVMAAGTYHLAEDTDPAARVRGRFGLWEPCGPPVPLADVELFLVPLVGFDHDGNRIGRGAGYMDRLLADRPATTVLVGLAHDLQELPRIVPAAHDVALDAVVTPTRTLVPRFRGAAGRSR